MSDHQPDAEGLPQPERKRRRKNSKPEVAQLPLAAAHYYDIEQLEAFISLVFHGLKDEVAVWRVNMGQTPGYPTAKGALLERLRDTRKAYALYFGTASLKRASDKKLYNRMAQFSALHVIVLDDVGTKVPLDSLPYDLRHKATYVIESSPGNFQYGYVLETPIADPALAKALVKLVYDSGYSDSGGAMPTKLVRLPEGVNGKANENGAFPVKLHHMKGPLWTPADLLHAVKSDVTWEQVEADTEATLKARKQVSATMWGPAIESPNLDGTVDPVLEWLYEQHMVYSEADPWVKVACPWGENHSDGKTDAGYSPIGRGEEGFAQRRGFHCFHESCKDHKTAEFLRFIAESGGPEVSVTEPAAKLIAEWAFDPVSNSAANIHTGSRITIQSFRNQFPGKVKAWHADGKLKMVPIVGMWLHAPNRLTLEGGVRLDPTKPDRIVRDDEGRLCLNLYRPPQWGDGKYDEDEVAVFLDFLEYLLPVEAEREFFLDWIACKAQDMAFRGPAILMVTPMQGTGRTTLADMLGEMFGEANTISLPFSKVIGHGDFNEWQELPLVVSDETLNMAEDQTVYKAYEAFKDVVDFKPKKIRLNAKYDRSRVTRTYSSYLLFSNHIDALRITGNDRRLVVMRNPDEPASPTFFNDLNEWIAEGNWAKAVWRWLRQRKVTRDMTAPAMSTELKRDMVRASRRPFDIAMDILVSLWKGKFIIAGPLLRALEQVAPRLHVEPKYLASDVRRYLNACSYPTHIRVRTDDHGQVRPRLLRERADAELLAGIREEHPPTRVVARAGIDVNANSTEELLKLLQEQLFEEDL